jgi:hypothetical protein
MVSSRELIEGDIRRKAQHSTASLCPHPTVHLRRSEKARNQKRKSRLSLKGQQLVIYASQKGYLSYPTIPYRRRRSFKMSPKKGTQGVVQFHPSHPPPSSARFNTSQPIPSSQMKVYVSSTECALVKVTFNILQKMPNVQLCVRRQRIKLIMVSNQSGLHNRYCESRNIEDIHSWRWRVARVSSGGVAN